MHFQNDGYNYLVRLDKGERLIERLSKFVVEQDIRGAWVSAVGGALRVELGFYNLEEQNYSWKTFNEPLEIASLQGTIAWKDNQPALHFHGVLSNQNMQTIGGHVKELVVAGTCEVFVHVWNKDKILKTHSEEIGLNLLDL